MPQALPQLPVTDAASVNVAFGMPIAANGRTVIPVAMVGMGFRGGFGSRWGGLKKPLADGQKLDNQPEKQSDVGAGMMSRLLVRPMGFIEVTDHRSRFVTIRPGRFIALGFGLAMLLGGLMMGGRRRRMQQLEHGKPTH